MLKICLSGVTTYEMGAVRALLLCVVMCLIKSFKRRYASSMCVNAYKQTSKRYSFSVFLPLVTFHFKCLLNSTIYFSGLALLVRVLGSVTLSVTVITTPILP